MSCVLNTGLIQVQHKEKDLSCKNAFECNTMKWRSVSASTSCSAIIIISKLLEVMGTVNVYLGPTHLPHLNDERTQRQNMAFRHLLVSTSSKVWNGYKDATEAWSQSHSVDYVYLKHVHFGIWLHRNISTPTAKWVPVKSMRLHPSRQTYCWAQFWHPTIHLPNSLLASAGQLQTEWIFNGSWKASLHGCFGAKQGRQKQVLKKEGMVVKEQCTQSLFHAFKKKAHAAILGMSAQEEVGMLRLSASAQSLVSASSMVVFSLKGV